MVSPDDCAIIGKVTKTYGTEGAIWMEVYDREFLDYPTEPVFLLMEGSPVPFYYRPDSVITKGVNGVILHFDYSDTMEKAERLVGKQVYREKTTAQQEEKPDFDLSELIGFEVQDSVSKQKGEVTDVVDYSGNIVLTVIIDGCEVLLPLGSEWVRSVKPRKRILIVAIPDELRHLND